MLKGRKKRRSHKIRFSNLAIFASVGGTSDLPLPQDRERHIFSSKNIPLAGRCDLLRSARVNLPTGKEKEKKKQDINDCRSSSSARNSRGESHFEVRFCCPPPHTARKANKKPIFTMFITSLRARNTDPAFAVFSFLLMSAGHGFFIAGNCIPFFFFLRGLKHFERGKKASCLYVAQS